MNISDVFNNFAYDFELCVDDDRWLRLEKYFTTDATYINVGGPDPKCEGANAILGYLQADVASTDRKFDARTLVALTPPTVAGNRLSRQWRCTYKLAGTPDLVIEGEARYLFADRLIKSIEEEPTIESMQLLESWMSEYGDKLQT